MLCSNGFSERGKERREKRIDEQKKRIGIELLVCGIYI
jgi:hypothetical protein